jgi:hypothetical protein
MHKETNYVSPDSVASSNNRSTSKRYELDNALLAHAVMSTLPIAIQRSGAVRYVRSRCMQLRPRMHNLCSMFTCVPAAYCCQIWPANVCVLTQYAYCCKAEPVMTNISVGGPAAFCAALRKEHNERTWVSKALPTREIAGSSSGTVVHALPTSPLGRTSHLLDECVFWSMHRFGVSNIHKPGQSTHAANTPHSDSLAFRYADGHKCNLRAGTLGPAIGLSCVLRHLGYAFTLWKGDDADAEASAAAHSSLQRASVRVRVGALV